MSAKRPARGPKSFGVVNRLPLIPVLDEPPEKLPHEFRGGGIVDLPMAGNDSASACRKKPARYAAGGFERPFRSHARLTGAQYGQLAIH